MDDTGPKSTASQSNIDELVKELSRPQGAAPAPSSPTTPMGQPPVSSMPPRPTPPPMTGSPAPSAPKPAPSAPPKEYQSSIRTMSEDLTKLKAGQQPQGVNVPRKIDNTPAPVPIPAKPVSPQGPVALAKPAPSSSMPSAVKSAPMPYSPAPAPKAPPTPVAIPKPVLPTMPPATKTPASSTDQKNQFYVPASSPDGKRPGSYNILFAGIALVVVIFGGLYWYFIIRSPSPDDIDVIATFTPRPSPTQNPDPLAGVFPNKDGKIALPASGDPTTIFRNAVANQSGVVSGGLVTTTITSGASASAQQLNVIGLMDRFVISYPLALKTSLGSKYRFLLYGQKEAFDTKGKPVAVSAMTNRLVIVSEIASSSATILKGWESSMSSNLAGIMSIDASKNTSSFMTTNYRGTEVRFKNFPYPDRSIDYTLISYNGKTYLIMASSRESMFATLDAFSVPGK